MGPRTGLGVLEKGKMSTPCRESNIIAAILIIIVLLISVNILKPTGYVMHHQFNIQQLYVLPTLYLCVLYLSENKQRLVPLTA